MLEVAQHSGCDFACACIRQQPVALILMKWCVTRDDMYLRVEVRLVADGPIRHDEVSEGVSRTPRVIALVEYRLLVNQVHDGVRDVADLHHGRALRFG